MATRLEDDNHTIDFNDDNAVICFLDDNSNFTCVHGGHYGITVQSGVLRAPN